MTPIHFDEPGSNLMAERPGGVNTLTAAVLMVKAKSKSRLFVHDENGVLISIEKKNPTKKKKNPTKKPKPTVNAVDLGYITAALVPVDCPHGMGNFTSWPLSQLKSLAHRQNLKAAWQDIEESQKRELAEYLGEIRSEWQLFMKASRDSPIYEWLQFESSVELARCVSCTVQVGLYGTGVFVDVFSDQAPWILTCAHNIDHDDDVEGEEPYRIPRFVTIVTMDNIVCAAVCRFTNSKHDLAILEPNFDAESKARYMQEKRFPKLRQSKHIEDVMCVGNSSWDNKKSPVGRFALAEGMLLKKENPRSNQYIKGLPSMRHSCNTNWGHSGGPIFSITDPALYGIHTSWNPNTRARHAVGMAEIYEFLNWVKRKCRYPTQYKGGKVWFDIETMSDYLLEYSHRGIR